MAELTGTTPDTVSSRCAPPVQAECCEPSEKDACCAAGAAGQSCGCAAGQAEGDVREVVRARYAAAARRAGDAGSWCCAQLDAGEIGEQTFGPALYRGEAGEAPAAAVNASLGCGVPTAVADMHDGETVLDLGSGAGADVLISARRVGTTGKAIGLDMTDEMLELARANAAEAGVRNVEIRHTHRVHEHAGSAIVRARRPAAMTA
jgi:hypothetical protein